MPSSSYFVIFLSSEQGADLDNIMWLTLDNIGEGGEECRVPGPAGLVGSGKAVGGVVSKVGWHWRKVEAYAIVWSSQKATKIITVAGRVERPSAASSPR